MLADFDQIVDSLFFPVDNVHALPLCELEGGAHLAHLFVMRDGRAGVVNRLLHLCLELLVQAGSSGVRAFIAAARSGHLVTVTFCGS
jgi:hypothetical protein